MFTCVFVTFPNGVWGQVWYFFVSIHELCLLQLFDGKRGPRPDFYWTLYRKTDLSICTFDHFICFKVRKRDLMPDIHWTLYRKTNLAIYLISAFRQIWTLHPRIGLPLDILQKRETYQYNKAILNIVFFVVETSKFCLETGSEIWFPLDISQTHFYCRKNESLFGNGPRYDFHWTL